MPPLDADLNNWNRWIHNISMISPRHHGKQMHKITNMPTIMENKQTRATTIDMKLQEYRFRFQAVYHNLFLKTSYDRHLLL
jgi:hypothetical protein